MISIDSSFYYNFSLSFYSLFILYLSLRRLIDLEAAACTSSLHLLWTMGGKEREDLGSKCLAGLNVISWSSLSMMDGNGANNSNHTYDVRNSNDSNMKVSNGTNINNYDSSNNCNNNSSNNNNNNNNSSSNYDQYHNNDNNNNNDNKISSNYNNSDNNTRNNNNKLKSDNAESILVLSRPYKKELDTDRLVKGDRVLISVERDITLKTIHGKKWCQNTEALGIMENSKMKSANLVNNLPKNSSLCDDIEDLCYSSSSSRGPSGIDMGCSNDDRNIINTSSTSDNTTHRNGLASIEPNVAVGQILKVTETEVHITLKSKPRRLLR